MADQNDNKQEPVKVADFGTINAIETIEESRKTAADKAANNAVKMLVGISVEKKFGLKSYTEAFSVVIKLPAAAAAAFKVGDAVLIRGSYYPNDTKTLFGASMQKR